MRLSDTKHRMPENYCISCGKPMTGASGVDWDERPTPGDFAVCLYCGRLSAYAEDLTLRALTDDELLEIIDDDRIIAMQKTVARMRDNG
jgi:hypothetical protein